MPTNLWMQKHPLNLESTSTRKAKSFAHTANINMTLNLAWGHLTNVKLKICYITWFRPKRAGPGPKNLIINPWAQLWVALIGLKTKEKTSDAKALHLTRLCNSMHAFKTHRAKICFLRQCTVKQVWNWAIFHEVITYN